MSSENDEYQIKFIQDKYEAITENIKKQLIKFEVSTIIENKHKCTKTIRINNDEAENIYRNIELEFKLIPNELKKKYKDIVI